MNSSVTIDENFQRAIQEKVFSGAQVLAGKDQTRLFQGCYGHLSWDEGEGVVSPGSRFDVASLTKPLVTAFLAYEAVQSGKLRLQERAGRYLQELSRPEAITVEQLLAHTSGLPAWLPLFEDFQKGSASTLEVREGFISRINQVPLLAKPGKERIYSDLGFLILGFLLEVVEGATLDELFARRLAEPLNLGASGFNPLSRGVSPRDIAATEEGDWRGKRLRGEVHDDNAYVLGGVAGHAGLFSTSGDIEKMVQGLWSLWDDPGMQTFVGPQVQPKLGWDSPSRPKSQAGQFFSAAAIGHLGFTGCSLWLDPLDRKYVILLSNCVHPHRGNMAIKEFRSQIHDRILEQLGLHS